MIERVKELLTLAGAEEKVLLQARMQAFKKNFKAFQEDPTSANNSNLAAVKKSLEEEIEKLWQKYHPAERSFKSLPEVWEYLKGEGYKVSRQTLYNHEMIGHIRAGGDGRFSIKEVEQYIRRAGLTLLDGSAPADDDEMQAKKQHAEIRRIIAQAESIELKTKLAKGESIDREQVGQEFAARAVVLKNDFKNFWRKYAPDIIALVGGDDTKTPDLIEYGLEKAEGWLGRYAEDREFVAKLPDAPCGPDDNSDEDEDNDDE